MRWCRPSDIGFVVRTNVQTAAFFAEKTLIRWVSPPHPSATRPPSPQGDGKKRSLSRERKKNNSFVIHSPPISHIAPQYHIRATAARSAGIQKGRSPFAHGRVPGNHGRVSRRPFRHLWRDKWRIYRGCIAKLRTINGERNLNL